MKDFFVKYFGLFGLVLYFVFTTVVRIPVAIFLLLFIAIYLLLWVPITGKDDTCKWIMNLYDWYCGK